MLNPEQQKLYDTVLSGEQVVLCLGEAGTGKSFTLSSILKDFPHPYVVTALSHKACGAINEVTGITAQTIHSYLQMVLTINGYEKALRPKTDRDGCQVPIKPTHLLVVDEISMLNDSLFQRIKRALEEGTIKQLLLLGDLVQLDTIGTKPDFNELNPTIVHLTQQMRQSTASPELTAYLAELRTAIETNQFFDPYRPSVPEFTYYNSHKDFCRAYLQCTDDKLITAYRNTKIDKYNMNIHPSGIFRPGDQVIVDKPLGKAANQTTATIIDVVEHEPQYYKLKLRNIHDEVHTVFHFTHKATLEYQLQKYRDNNDYIGYHRALDQCFNLKLSYAVTTTKAQGSTIDHIWVDLNDITSAYTQPKNKYNNPISLNQQLRYIYVSISRMKSHCSLFIGNTRDYSKLQPKGPK